MKKINVYLIIILSAFLTGCDRDKDSTTKKDVLPAITQEGKNTFGCKVNGEVWLPQASSNKLTSSYQNGVFIMNAIRNTDDYSEGFGISQYFLQETIFNLNNYDAGVVYNKSNQVIGFHSFTTNAVNVGVLNIIKLDTTEGIISGTFYFDALDTTTNEVVHVTDGRFDVKY